MTTLPSSVVELVRDRLFALGGAVDADRPLSWFAPGFTGRLPLNCYVYRSGNHFLLIDTGVPAHKARIREGIVALIEGATRREVLVTRREPDTLNNLPWIVRDFAIHEVYAGGDLNPLEFFDTIDEANATAHIKAETGVTTSFVRPGAVVKVGDDIELTVIGTLLRILTTNWYYEAKTRTLFSSEVFGYLTRDAVDGPFVAKPTDDDISPERLVQFLGGRLDWLRGIDTTPIIADFRKAVEGRDIERICPTAGGVIEGRETVKKAIANLIQALEDIGRQPRQSALGDFDFGAARAANVLLFQK